ncbi:helix-hairpin-helix domain-containing protein [Saprospira sp. CCB-QB6]|uniref:PHP domain-containing protein n=1 Tax=Saprospira sp. CCB-QB6 TaxID=3023936 RepID=UPI00234AB05D|nr:PHP domain-containing protein [Saprospira sp. CCB-QB6]WCL81922.1 helix-hairpin-helix domain-containing protein [Saprospira sp. CCB-QB6]
MTNKAIADQFKLLGGLMELHQENPYKIKSYKTAYQNLRKVDGALAEMPKAELKKIRGIGDAIADKIIELQEKGELRLLQEYKAKTPKGIIALMNIKGLGTKKLLQLWQELEIESPGELLYACQENRLLSLKGFGEKSQQNMESQLQYYFRSLDQHRWAEVADEAEDLLLDLQEVFGTENVALTGPFRREMPVVEALDFLIADFDGDQLAAAQLFDDLGPVEPNLPSYWQAHSKDSNILLRFHPCAKDRFGLGLLQSTGGVDFFRTLTEQEDLEACVGLSETAIFEKLELPFIWPSQRDAPKIYWRAKAGKIPPAIEQKEIQGMLHLHSTYSDGANSLSEMAEHIRSLGYAYMGITDHSQSAFYANGLKPERVKAQWKEIDELNANFSDFHIYKGIESDIKYDGSLDYEAEVLAGFDFIIASVHSHLKMSKEKAMERLLKAIANPYTNMLGHPTGRLLLSRPGYPVDHALLIEACAKYNVAIEINANPLRLDLDHQWIPYALEKGVKLAINTDAHQLRGLDDIRYGLQMARKGLLPRSACINCFSDSEFAAWCKQKR